MPGFNVSDLIENHGFQAVNNVECRPNQTNAEGNVKESVQPRSVNMDNFYSTKSNGYDCLINLVRNVFQKQFQHHQHQVNSSNPGSSNHSGENLPTSRPIPTISDEPAVIPSFLNDIGCSPQAWQRLFYLYPELVDQIINPNSIGTHADMAGSTDLESSMFTEGTKRSLSGTYSTSGLTNDRTTDLSGTVISPRWLSAFGLTACRAIAQAVETGVNTINTPTSSSPMTDYTSWFESANVNILGSSLHRTSQYMDPRTTANMDYCSKSTIISCHMYPQIHRSVNAF